MDETICRSAKKNGVVHAYIVHSDDGMNEISPFDKTNVVELRKGIITQFSIDPKNLGLNSKENLKEKMLNIILKK